MALEVADAEEDEEEKASTANNADDGSSKNNVLMNRESIISCPSLRDRGKSS